ncbi:aminotransferase class I/II-fold pyridoxal phosphate-dependent enzyme [Nosocomiicoccus massiliensis]|uniref:aminotransferase class I/II-fold pyridoxal phosphate-dependent enzyme n=1 Tax=Nosocomiicoccus massiliensis TaxID=1232430 RepID=UPI0003FDFAFE|nr:aminotransferase class I/II-fold pyridoxal phosphate-dependent enzyme [Nosocomiicoccus massiliensis]
MANKRLMQLEGDFFMSLRKRLEKIKLSDKPLLNMSIGVPDGRTPDHVLENVKETIDDIQNHKYAGVNVRENLMQAIKDFYKRHYDVELEDENIALLYGSKNAIINFPSLFIEPGEGVYIPNPGYIDYLPGVKLANGEVYDLPLLKENDFLPDFDNLDEKELENARLIILNYPSNPVGAVATKEFFDETVERFKDTDIMLINDFAYAAFGFEGKPPSILESDKNFETSMEFFSLSKAFNMSGFRVGFAVGNKDMVGALNLYQSFAHAGMWGVQQEAAATALNESDEFLLKQNEIFKRRRDKFVSGLREVGIPLNDIDGGMFGWVEVPKGFNSESFFEYLLEEQSIMVIPGFPFGSLGENRIRVSLAIADEELDEVVERFQSISHLWKE